MSIVTELVTMKTKEPIGKDEFIRVIDALECNFHCKQDGFVDTKLLYDEKEDTWIMILHWDSLEQMKTSSANMFRDDATASFRDVIDAKTISIRAFPVLGAWCTDDAI